MGRKRVLFVCLGNICRSPAAEGVLREYIARQGLQHRYQVDSAGVSGYHVGDPPDRRMREAARRRGYDLRGAARRATPDDLARFDLILGMDRSNLRELRRLPGAERAARRLGLFCDYLPDSTLRDVPDPYYGGPAGFDQVLDLLEEAVPHIVTRLEDGEPD